MKLYGTFWVTYSDGTKSKRKNLEMDYMRNKVAELFITGGSASGIKISYIALGTGTTGATGADTKLETETYRKLATVTRSANNRVLAEIDVGGDVPLPPAWRYRELGVFAGGSSTKDSGYLLARVVDDVLRSPKLAVKVGWELEVK